ncbi:MAG: triacylglycerol lipase [Kiritimatiellia bacterium]|jgi:triacylglycerol lipase
MVFKGWILMTAGFLQSTANGATPLPEAPVAERTSPDYVVVLHGMGRTHHSMARVAHHFSRQGYTVINRSYPSRDKTIHVLSEEWLHSLLEREITDPQVKVHFVTHSLGGIVLRHYLKHHELPNLGRVVMLAPPNQGSELVPIMGRLPIYGWIVGPAGLELGIDEDAVPLQLGPATFELGVIAGNRSLNPVYSWMIPGPDDGKVSVARARLDGMRDFVTVPYSHTWLMNRKNSLQHMERFIRTGAFEEPLGRREVETRSVANSPDTVMRR